MGKHKASVLSTSILMTLIKVNKHCIDMDVTDVYDNGFVARPAYE